jgi:hypothetical protein
VIKTEFQLQQSFAYNLITCKFLEILRVGEGICSSCCEWHCVEIFVMLHGRVLMLEVKFGGSLYCISSLFWEYILPKFLFGPLVGMETLQDTEMGIGWPYFQHLTWLGIYSSLM